MELTLNDLIDEHENSDSGSNSEDRHASCSDLGRISKGNALLARVLGQERHPWAPFNYQVDCRVLMV